MRTINKHWQVLKTHTIYEAPPWVRLTVQEVRMPNGKVIDDYHQILLPEYVVIYAQTRDEDIIVERAYRHGAGNICLSLPAGLVEPGESPIDTAKRELLEETGFIAEDWRLLGKFTLHGNYGCGVAHLFAAKKARPVAEPDSGDLENIEILLMKEAEIVRAIKIGQMALIGTVAAFALATNPLFKEK